MRHSKLLSPIPPSDTDFTRESLGTAYAQVLRLRRAIVEAQSALKPEETAGLKRESSNLNAGHTGARGPG